MMCGAWILMCLIALCVASADIAGEVDILKRLDVTENLVREVLLEMDALKSQNKIQKIKIADMESQFLSQKQRNNKLEERIRRTTGESTNIIRREEIESPVAFFAKMTNHLEHAGIHQTFIFETVVTNVGNSYHSHLGAFIAPVPGIYVFSTTLVSRHFNSAHAQFVKNGGPITTMYVSSGNSGDETTSQTIVLQLQQGDDVTVENLDPDKAFYGGNHSSFSGFLLQEDYSSSAIVGK